MEEIKIKDVIKFLVSKKRTILWTTVIFGVLGLVMSLTSPTEWRSKNTLVIISNSAMSLPSSLGGLAGIAGIDIGSAGGGGQINPESYQEILGSEFFIDKLAHKQFYSLNLGDSISLFDYQLEYNKSSLLARIGGLPGLIIGLFTSSGDESEGVLSNVDNSRYLFVNMQDQQIFDAIINRLSVQFDKINSTLSIGFMHQDPYLAAQTIEFANKYLDQYINDFELLEKKKSFDFIEDQIILKEAEYKAAQHALVEFQDNNVNLASRRALSEEKALQEKRDLSFSLYTSLQNKRQELEIDLASNDTNLRTLGKTQIPVKKASTSKKIILALYIILGVFLSSSYLVMKEFLFSAEILEVKRRSFDKN